MVMPKALENRGKIRKAPRSKELGARRRMAEAADLHLMDFERRSVPLVFQENRRARRIILRLDYGASRIVVVLPKRTTRHEGKRFALQNRDWIEERLDQLPETVAFKHGSVIPFLGIPHLIRHRAH